MHHSAFGCASDRSYLPRSESRGSSSPEFAFFKRRALEWRASRDSMLGLRKGIDTTHAARPKSSRRQNRAASIGLSKTSIRRAVRQYPELFDEPISTC